MTFTTTYEGTEQNGKFAMTQSGGRGGRGARGPVTGDFERSTAEAAMPPAKLSLPAFHDVADNGLARTPPMGWNSWNKFAGAITAKDVREMADAMVSSGMKKAGYIYVNIDDTWEGRDAEGNITGQQQVSRHEGPGRLCAFQGIENRYLFGPGPQNLRRL